MAGSRSTRFLRKTQVLAEYFYYKCHRGAVGKLCTNKGRLKEGNLEAFILENIEENINDYVYKATVTVKSKPKKKYNKKKILEEMDRLYYAYKAGRISQKIYDTDFADLEGKLKAAELESPESENIDTATLEKFLNSDWRKVYETLDKENKRSLWRNLIKRVYYNHEDNTFTLEFF